MIKVRNYEKGDIYEMNLSTRQPELNGLKKFELDKQFTFPVVKSFTIYEEYTGKIIMVAGVMFSNHLNEAPGSEIELATVFSEELSDNFIAYFKPLYKLFKYIFSSTGIDFLVCLCYNSNIRGQELLKKLKFKETDIESPLPNYKLFVCKR